MRFATLTVSALVWASAIYGATQLHKLDLPVGHSICGPWGCAAAPESLLGYHLFWLAVLGPLVALTCRALPHDTAVWMVTRLAGIAAVAALAVVAGSTVAWLRDGGATQYALQRGLFVLATTPDAPMLQLVLAAGLGRLATPRRSPAGADRAVDSSGLSRENQPL